jgi:hypothetical protein
MLTLHRTLTFYKRKDIQEELVRQAKDKEVAFRFNDFFGKRPEILNYPEDVMELAKQKVTSFHCSEELWSNPLQLSSTMKKEDMQALRKGWDLILDIDCHFFEYSRIAAHLVVMMLKAEGVNSVSAKFSGNKGFHIAVPFEAFPEVFAGKRTCELFPEAARKIALYVTESIRTQLAGEIFRYEKMDFSSIMRKTGYDEIKIKRYERNEFGDQIPVLNVDPFLEIDTILIASRHLYRMPYSMHEKSGLVSVPVDASRILEFEKEMASPEKVKVQHPFLARDVGTADAALLLRNAYDFSSSDRLVDVEKPEKTRKAYFEEDEGPQEFIGEEHFPPCMKLVLEGLEDGRKRMSFALINFLVGCGWDYEKIEARLFEWNEKNREPLREVNIVGPLRYHKQQAKKAPPPNCNNPGYYLGVGVCKPDGLCKRVKNPLQYAKLRHKMSKQPVKKAKVSKQAGQQDSGA